MLDLELARCVEFDEPRPGSAFLAPSYPGLGGVESEIWDRFLTTTGMKFLGICYNTHVGPGGSISPSAPDEIRKMWKAKTRLRIDAVCEDEDQFWVVEVKPRFGRSALGQLLSYEHWLEREQSPPKPVRSMAVVKRMDPNMEDIAFYYGIKVQKV